MSQPALQPRSRMPRISPRFAEAAVARARLTVVPRQRRKTAKVPFVALITLVMVGGVVGLLLFNTSMQQASFAATALQDQADTLAAREQTLRMELDVLRNPQRIAEQAQRMGMVPAVGAAYLDLHNGKVLGTPVPATRVDNVRIYPKAPAKPRLLDPAPIVHTEIVTGAPSHGNAAASGDDGQQTHQQSNQQSARARRR